MSDPFELTDDPAPMQGNAPPGIGAPDYLTGLNEGQRAAVETVEGPVLVLAGAGTGKTRALTTRLAHILVQGFAHPQEMLAVTFTNKAAREMKERVGQLVERDVEGWWIGTFHALGARILRVHAELVGLQSNFTILDADDQLRLLKQICQAEDVDDKRWPARTMMGVIQRWKDRGLTPDKVSDIEEGVEHADGRAVELYQIYQDRLKVLNAADFGDLLLHCLTLFQTAPDVLKSYQQRFRYILVDEYQDTNVAQYLWLRLLAQGYKNICCVGDDDQSIYSWRGAEVGNILRFEEDFPGARVVRLERNYRSTGHILGAASGLIANNEGRLGKTLWTEDDQGERVVVQGVWDGQEEARVVGDEIENHQRKDISLRDMAVLVRAGFQMREFEERLITLGVPYRIIGGPRFYERKEIRDAIAYLRMVVQPADSLAFERIVNVPKRGIGEATVQVIHGLSRVAAIPLAEATAQLIETDEIKPKQRKTLGGLLDDFERWRGQLSTMNHADLAALILDESGYMDALRMDKSPEAAGRVENLKELVVAIEEFETLPAFLEHVSLVMENETDASQDKVSLMTLHGAKGLEFDLVFLPGWEEGVFPHQRALDEGGHKGLEEERRLAYVGITRARKQAYIVHAANRRIYNQWQSALPSRFIDELPAEHIDRRGGRGLYGSQRDFGGGLSDGGASGFAFAHPRRRRPVIDAEAFDVAAVNRPSRFSVGQRVFHQKFGYGTILHSDGGKLEIAFEKAGTKKVMENFVEEP